MIVPHDTLIQRMAGDSGIAFHKPELLKNALTYATSHFQELKANAEAKKQDMLDKYSVERYLKCLVS